MTIEEGSFDWDLFLKEYFYYFDIWGLMKENEKDSINA
jgi:hypothetical protein